MCSQFQTSIFNKHDQTLSENMLSLVCLFFTVFIDRGHKVSSSRFPFKFEMPLVSHVRI